MSIRKYTNPRETDLSRGLQEVLQKNGMQAHISVDNTGAYQLVVLGHDSPVLRYPVTEKQVEDMMAWGSNYANKHAYQTFTSIVKNDFDMPDGFVAARNVGGRVMSGLHGYRIGNGEYGYRAHYDVPFFRPFHVGGRGWGGDFMGWSPRMHSPGFHGRRIDGRYFGGGPLVPERPDGRMKPGELRSGGYGFYYKGNQGNSQQVLDDLNVKEAVLKPLESAPRPVGEAKPYKELITSNLYFSADNWNEVLKSHGLVIDTDSQTGSKRLIVQSSKARVDMSYPLTSEEVNKLLAPKIKGKDAVSIKDRIDVINKVIAQDFSEPVTMAMLNSKNLVDVDLKPEVKQEVEAKFIEREKQIQAQQQRMAERQAFKDANQAEHNRLLNEADRIKADPQAINGREIHDIMGNYGFFTDARHGREAVVGEIRVEETAGHHYLMSAEINGTKITHGIDKKQYDNFMALDDEHRLRLFADIFKEVKIGRDNGGRDFKTPDIINVKDAQGNYVTREQADIEYARSNGVDGSTLSQIKNSKGFYREIENGREVNVGDIHVDKLADDKYRMSAVIDGTEVCHDITQKQYDKFLAVDDYQRMKLFSKVFPEVDMKTRPGMGSHVNVGAAILAALVVGTEAAHDIAHIVHGPGPGHFHDDPLPGQSATIYSKQGVVSPGEVAMHNFSENLDRMGVDEHGGISRGI